MKIVLVPGEGENIEEILSVKPTLSVSGFILRPFMIFRRKHSLPILKRKILLLQENGK